MFKTVNSNPIVKLFWLNVAKR